MKLDWLLEGMARYRDDLAVASPAGAWTYGDLIERAAWWQRELAEHGCPGGSVVSVEGDYGADSIGLFLAIANAGSIVVPLSSDVAQYHERFAETAEIEFRVACSSGTEPARVTKTGRTASHALYGELRQREHPGLVLFSSGSTGAHKAAVHDLSLLLEKFKAARHRRRTLVFLLLDHIGGVNTLLYTVANGGAVVVPPDRTPAGVCGAIAKYQVELLPTSPTFLNLLLLSGEYARHDLSSLKLITYGTEPMPQSTLDRLVEAFPGTEFLQTYGLTEIGILRSKSRDKGSLWVQVGGEDFQTKIVDGRLWVKAKSAMLGYLNAPSPIDAEGYLDTGDLVEVDGPWIRFLGRKSDIINVGGLKVYPAEVENLLLQMENVEDVSVKGEPNPITGQIVVATVRLKAPETPEAFKVRMRQFCTDKLANWKVPARVRFTDQAIHSARFKRVR
jgi:acyl-CoA synthetase (AMP-forming)/AMP-acid ligase II